MTQPQQSDPIESALAYHSHVSEYIEEVRTAELEAQEAAEAAEAAEAERTEEAQSTARTSVRTTAPSSSLPPLLQTIRAHESGGNYSAYNATGCEGYGCGGAYQLHANYASVWAERAGYPGLGSNAAVWSAPVQDAVALDLFYSTNPDGAHWCDWTDYC